MYGTLLAQGTVLAMGPPLLPLRERFRCGRRCDWYYPWSITWNDCHYEITSRHILLKQPWAMVQVVVNPATICNLRPSTILFGIFFYASIWKVEYSASRWVFIFIGRTPFGSLKWGEGAGKLTRQREHDGWVRRLDVTKYTRLHRQSPPGCCCTAALIATGCRKCGVELFTSNVPNAGGIGYSSVWYGVLGNIIKIKIHSSCEIEDFVETHLCKLCVILRSRALRVVCPRNIW